MSLIDSLWVRFCNKQVGVDQFGNKYFIGRQKNYLGKQKRFVLYKGMAEGSKVPALWHAWLHHLSDKIPAGGESYVWQREYVPNLTGTKYAHNPREYSLNKLKSYISWNSNK